MPLRSRLFLLAILFAATIAFAAPEVFAQTAPASAPGPRMASQTIGAAAEAYTRRGLVTLDWLVIAAYAVGMLAIGVFYSGDKGSEEYLLGGRRMRSSSIGLSLFATLISTITYLAMPGEVIRYGPVALCYLFMLPAIYPIVAYGLIPYFMKLPVTSAYELLETRLGLNARLLAASFFLLTRLVWMALITYATSKMFVIMMGWSPDKIVYVATVMGLVTVVYTSMGGIKAVVLTDVIQSWILFGGAVLSIVLVTWKMGGVGEWWPREWQSHWDAQPVFSTDPHVRVTVVGSLSMMFLWWICTAGSDQMAIQRYLAVRDAKAARRAFMITLIANLLTNLTLGLLGFALLGFFKAHPDYLSGGPTFTKDTDYLFPHYIANFLPIGAAGLVVAGVLAAAMSSLASGINSACSVITRDFIDRSRQRKDGTCPPFAHLKLLSLGIGLLVVLASILIQHIPGNIYEVSTRTNHLFVAPLFGLFFMAMFVKFATPFGTLVGAVYGLAAAMLIGYWDMFTGDKPLSFQYITLISLAANLAAGVLVSRFTRRDMSAPALVAWLLVTLAPLVVVIMLVPRY